MLIADFRKIGNNLYKIRKSKGLTQAEVAERAELSDRTYADIERGCVSMRLDTLLKICESLKITPNDILVDDSEQILSEEIVISKLSDCTNEEKKAILKILNICLDNIK
ncbi:MAG: helix-turn-helix transcriptional regulator [Clostridia bacterium]|nr:helix-turn-helix transcriptional regulator [Clostridia bacterium]